MSGSKQGLADVVGICYVDDWSYEDKNEKALGETQTLPAGCSEVESKISPRRRPPYRGHRTAKI